MTVMFAAAAYAARPVAPKAGGLNVTTAVTAFDGAALYPEVGCATRFLQQCAGAAPAWGQAAAGRSAGTPLLAPRT